MKKEVSPAVIAVIVVVALAVVGYFGWKTLGGGSRGGGKNPYQGAPAGMTSGGPPPGMGSAGRGPGGPPGGMMSGGPGSGGSGGPAAGGQ